MKTLGLIRHAKSSWRHSERQDRERPLNPRGQRDLERMPNYLKAINLQPDLIISSPAVRAYTTAKGFARFLSYSSDNIQIVESLYEATLRQLLAIVEKIGETHDCVLMFGHNPVFTEATNYLGNHNIDNLPTCGIAIISFPVSAWGQIQTAKQSRGRLEHLFLPKDPVVK